MAYLDMLVWDALWAGIQAFWKADWLHKAPLDIRVILRVLITLGKIQTFWKHSLTVRLGDKVYVVSHWFWGRSFQSNGLFFNDFDCHSIEFDVFRQRREPAFHRKCTTERHISIGDRNAILNTIVRMPFKCLNTMIRLLSSNDVSNNIPAGLRASYSSC